MEFILLQFHPILHTEYSNWMSVFFNPLKTNYAEEVRLWHITNPGKALVPVNVPEIFTKAYSTSCRMQLATSGFSATGIVPFNRQIFTDEDFSAADLLLPVEERASEDTALDPQSQSEQPGASRRSLTEEPNMHQLPSTSAEIIEHIAPLPRINPARSSKKRKCQTSVLVNSTPMKEK